MAASQSPHNRLLAAMSPADFLLVQPHLAPLALPLRLDIEKPNRPIDRVCFPESGIISVVALQGRDTRVEIGLIGREGMTGTAIALGSDRTPHSTYVQVAGEGQCMFASALRSVVAESETLRNLMLRYAQTFLIQTAHTAVANASGKLDQRLARWLLMAHDRMAGNSLPLTHEFLGLMLAVRRAGVTQAVQSLGKKGFIRAARGKIEVINRKGLEREAGELYGVPEAEMRRLLN
jgi:CRP-like cAMP-binding protein